MNRWRIYLIVFISLILDLNISCATPVVNVYVWGGELPQSVIKAFENETKIHVNLSNYDNNETMYAKLKANKKSIYDVILPSGYYVERMKRLNMLEKIDSNQLPNKSNLEKFFTKIEYDPENNYSIPLIWGTTGIFYNQQLIDSAPKSWNDLWSPSFKQKLLLLDDAREIFSIALLSLGYSPNDTNPVHINAALAKLLTLVPNIKLFASEGIQALIIDADAVIGAVWNGDINKSLPENSHLRFVYPKEGFVIWMDCLAIPKNPPHPNEAHKFINFLLKPEIAAQISLQSGYAITNKLGISKLPSIVRNNKLIYPDLRTLKRGIFQRDLGEATIELLNHYWEKLKLTF